MKPKSKAQKQLAAAKAVGKKRIAAEAARVGEAVEETLSTRPVVKTKPGATPAPSSTGVFLDRSRRTHILTRTEGNTSYYLTARDEEIKVVKMPRGGLETRDLIPYEYDVKKAVQKLYNWKLPKSPEAIQEMCHILDLPIPEIPVEVIEKRKEAGKRLQSARAAAHPEHKALDGRKITLLAKANPRKAGTTRAARFALYTNGMTVSEFVTAGGFRADIKCDVDEGNIKLA